MRLIIALLLSILIPAAVLAPSARANNALAESEFAPSSAFNTQQKVAFDAAVNSAKSAKSAVGSVSISGFKLVPPALSKSASATLIEFNEWAKLSIENQELYLLGIQRLMLDLEAEDEALQTDYQSASLDPQILDWLLPTAQAKDVTRRCVYAGWVSEMDINNRFCMTPTSQGCRRGQVQCNPILYGENKCAKAGRSATSICNRNKKSSLQIVKEIRVAGKAGMNRWNALRTELKGYCADPRPKQRVVCGVVRAQVVQLERVIGKTPKIAIAIQSAPTTTSTDVPQKISVSPVDNSDSEIAEPFTKAAATAVASTAVASTAVKIAPKTHATGHCNDASLLGNMKLVRGTSPQGLNLMSIDSAQAMMCTNDSIPKDWAAKIRERLNKRLGVLGGNDSEAKLAKRNMITLLENFEVCYQKAVLQRAAGIVPSRSVRLSLIPKTSEGRDFIKLVRADGSVLTETSNWSDLEGLLKIDPTSVCGVSVPTGAQAAEISGPIAVPSGSSGSIQ